MKNLNTVLKLCLLTHVKHQSFGEYLSFIERAVRGGVTMVQLREEDGDPDIIKEKAIALKKLLKPWNVPLIINDFVEIARAIDAEGVHLGQQDMSPIEARKILGPEKIIGLSIESLSELSISRKIDAINYVTASAVYPSKTKPDCKKMWGLEGLKQIVNHASHPVTAIGGINRDNVREIMRSGVEGIAVIGAIHDAADPYYAALMLKEEMEIKSSSRKINYLRS